MNLWQRLCDWLARPDPQDFEPLGTMPIPEDMRCPGEDTQKLYADDDEQEGIMRTILIAVVIVGLTGCESLPGVEISEDEKAQCERETCTVWTRGELESLVREAMRRGYAAGRKSL